MFKAWLAKLAIKRRHASVPKLDVRPHWGHLAPRVDRFEEEWKDGIPLKYRAPLPPIEYVQPVTSTMDTPPSKGTFNILEESCAKCGVICSCLHEDEDEDEEF